MAGEWRTARLSDLIEVKHGYAFEGRYITDAPSGPVLVTPGNFDIGGGFVDARRYYTGPIPDEFVLSPYDLIVSMTDLSKAGDTLGYSALVPNNGETYLHNQRIGKVVLTDPATVSLAFVGWLMRSPSYRHNVMAGATGSTVRHTSPSRIGSLNFSLPPRPEQDKIVGLLSCLEDKIALNREISETLETIARALFQSWFVDFKPILRAAAGEDTGLPAELVTLFPSSLTEAGLPEGWTRSTLGREFMVKMGQSPPGSTYNEVGIGLPFYQGRSDFGFRFPKKRVYCDGATRVVAVGDTLLSVRAPVGSLNLANEKSAIGRGVAGLMHRSNSRTFTYYSLLALQHVVSTFDDSGTVFGSINKDQLANIRVLRPPERVIQAFVKVIEPLDQRVDISLAEMETLSNLRDTLLPKLMSGELRICDAEKIAETA